MSDFFEKTPTEEAVWNLKKVRNLFNGKYKQFKSFGFRLIKNEVKSFISDAGNVNKNITDIDLNQIEQLLGMFHKDQNNYDFMMYEENAEMIRAHLLVLNKIKRLLNYEFSFYRRLDELVNERKLIQSGITLTEVDDLIMKVKKITESSDLHEADEYMANFQIFNRRARLSLLECVLDNYRLAIEGDLDGEETETFGGSELWAECKIDKLGIMIRNIVDKLQHDQAVFSQVQGVTIEDMLDEAHTEMQQKERTKKIQNGKENKCTLCLAEKSDAGLQACSWCGVVLCKVCMVQKKINFGKCSKCEVVRYCSVACQKQDWRKTHKKECKILAATSSEEAVATPSEEAVATPSDANTKKGGARKKRSTSRTSRRRVNVLKLRKVRGLSRHVRRSIRRPTPPHSVNNLLRPA